MVGLGKRVETYSKEEKGAGGERKKKKRSEWPLGALAVGTLEPAADGRRQAHRHGAAHDRPGGGGLVSKMRKWFGSKTKQNEPGAQIASEKSGHPSKVSSPTWNAASPNQPQQQQAAVRQQPAQSARTSFSSPDASEEDTQTSVRYVPPLHCALRVLCGCCGGSCPPSPPETAFRSTAADGTCGEWIVESLRYLLMLLVAHVSFVKNLERVAHAGRLPRLPRRPCKGVGNTLHLGQCADDVANRR
ncbi:hypothetical protein HPB50_023629 [Hyalomma asiaticum]|uniref:Uncharacterized protein n=1 Tax=Hyalomma asiaticum TaxID=266040 RepID=A0ACB7T6R1_HYAAI|nr:hypothetical protein HPB50_023629 [Hyalomma asiaticum]